MTKRKYCPSCGASLQFGKGRPKTIDGDKILTLWNKGLTLQAVADKMKCSVGAVHKVITFSTRI